MSPARKCSSLSMQKRPVTVETTDFVPSDRSSHVLAVLQLLPLAERLLACCRICKTGFHPKIGSSCPSGEEVAAACNNTLEYGILVLSRSEHRKRVMQTWHTVRRESSN